MTLFLRLLDSENKEDALGEALAQVRDGKPMVRNDSQIGFDVHTEDFSRVPGNPFAYWASKHLLQIFSDHTSFEESDREAWVGLQTNNDFRWIRLFFEIPSMMIQNRWTPFAKGGAFSPYYSDVHLLVEWANNGYKIKEWKLSELAQGRITENNSKCWNESKYFRPGLTWSRRSQIGISLRVLPSKSIFADKGPVLFDLHDDTSKLWPLLALINSNAYCALLKLQMAFGSYEVGVLRRTPVPNLDNPDGARLGELALACVELKRDLDRTNETSHVFHLPALLQVAGATLAARAAAWAARVRETDAQLERNQAEIDEIAFRLYGIGDEDRAAIESNAGLPSTDADAPNDDDDDQPPTTNHQQPTTNNQPSRDLISYALGCVFGRWDIRFATGERATPELPDPFAPLPAYSPGMLRRDADALPALRPDEDGLLADDEGHPADIVRQVRLALDIIWDERAEAIEREITAALGVKSLRDYLQKKGKGGFWPDHIGRYSKSRRKAPIYWLLQSPKGKYGLWLYYPKLNGDTLAKALTGYVEPKLRRELERLATLRAQAQSSEGSARRALEREVERQEDLLNDIQEFRDRLERVTRRGLRPDHNDGVLLTIAPLWELTPWPEAKRAWEELQAGKYEWSSVSKQLQGEGGNDTLPEV